ncbi:MAG: sigma 54-interacting transcriptional regulator [Acidobacteria bacterium]|nr:sigma 54-interacting transcriptional regulator [Acidobacteriota bacterium]
MNAIAQPAQSQAARYEALLRAGKNIAGCRDCNSTAACLTSELHSLVKFDYLQVIAFDSDVGTALWQVTEANGKIDIRSISGFSQFADTPTAWVHEHGEAVVTADWCQETRFSRQAQDLPRLGMASSCTLPLVRGERRVGIVTFASSRVDAYPPSEFSFLQLVADQLAMAIDASVHFYSSRRARERLKLILDLTNQVVSNLAFPELLRAISSSVRQTMRADAAAIMLPEGEGKTLRVHALDFPESKGFFTEQVSIPVEGSLPGQTFLTGKPMVVNRIDPAAVPPHMYRKAKGEGLNSFCDVALVSRNRLLGVLAVGRREEYAFDEEEVSFLSQIARQVAIAVENAFAYSEIRELKDKLAQEKLYLEDEIRGEMDFEGIVGQSSGLRHVLTLVETVAPSDSTVLLLGETGTGKELIARAIHERSRRRDRTFVKLNCAAIPTGLVESELFGHERGAFTGAISQKIGRLELADRGTLFLDEVGDIPLEVQPKLLRALQEREFERLGSSHTKTVDVRLVAATNRDLESMIANREFRSDLYYRLNVFPIRIPPLRERPEDIPLLVRYFAQRYGRRMEKRIESIPGAAMKKLSSWYWPGNIRELENFIERSVILTHGSSLEVPTGELGNEGKSVVVPVDRPASERDEILRILKQTNGRVGGKDGAAARMHLKRTTLISRMKKLGIDSRKVS